MMSNAVPPLIDVTGVAVIGDHRLRLLFEDGTVGDVSFEGHKWPGVLAPLGDPGYFAQVEVRNGTVHWPQDDLDLAPEPLYDAALANALARPATASAA